MKRSNHNLGHTQLLTCDMGQLVPIGLTEVLPGDTIQHATSLLIRCSPLATPPMHPVRIAVHHWFVPNRILWDDWEDFITGGPDGDDASVFPTISFINPTQGTLADYLGISPGTFTRSVSALPFRAYAKIYNEWYRDQDLMPEVGLSTASGVDSTTNISLLNCAWEKDYFTTCRPWEQKGPELMLPIGTKAPVKTDAPYGAVVGVVSSTQSNAIKDLLASSTSVQLNNATVAADRALYADLSAATGVPLNQVREYFGLQRYMEARARYGSRYSEYLRYMGVISSDARLQRPEYLGGGKQTMQFSEVLQTGSTTADPSGVGQLYGHGIAGLRSNRYRKFFEEHGFIVSVAHVLPQTMYPQGLFRHWNKRTKEEFYQMELAHIGQQSVLNKEVYLAHSDPDGTFGYQDRYDEYRRAESQVHGEFRTTLNDWHFARLFASNPVLNENFVKANPAVRPFQSQSTNVLYCAARHQIIGKRIVPKVGSSFLR